MLSSATKLKGVVSLLYLPSFVELPIPQHIGINCLCVSVKNSVTMSIKAPDEIR